MRVGPGKESQMKLLHRPNVHETPERVEETSTRVPESHEVVEHHRRVTAKPAPAARSVRWLRWVPVVLLIVAAMVVLGIVASGDDAGNDASNDLGVWQTTRTGPGSNSLGPTPVIEFTEPYHPATGPGSTSLGPTD